MDDVSRKFDQWWNQLEGFGLRSERFYADVDRADPAQLVQWLRAAYMQGAQDADTATAAALISIANQIVEPSQPVYNNQEVSGHKTMTDSLQQKTQCRPAQGTTGCLIYSHALREYFFRVYDSANNFVDYNLLHCDLQVTIDDVDAYFYQDSAHAVLDHAPDTMGIDPR
jgi:hypothetical protein